MAPKMTQHPHHEIHVCSQAEQSAVPCRLKCKHGHQSIKSSLQSISGQEHKAALLVCRDHEGLRLPLPLLQVVDKVRRSNPCQVG